MPGANRSADRSGPPEEPSPPEVRAQLDRMLAGRTFAGTDRLSRMLRYLVETAVEGSAAQPKEYTVGIDVFDRDASFDPRTDSVVRVHGSRLRSRLSEYYASAGPSDRVIIELPKGGYVPVFRYNPASAERRVIPLQPPPTAFPARGRSWNRRRTMAAAISACVLLAAAIGLYRYLSPGSSSPVTVRVRPITSMAGSQMYPSFSPDGSQVVFAWDGESGESTNIYVTTRDGGPVQRITTGTEGDTGPAWSPDGRYIAFRRGERAVMLVSPLGGPVRKIGDSDAAFVSFTPDSERVLTAKFDGQKWTLFAVSIVSGQEQPVTAAAETPDGIQRFAISPDGRYLGYGRREGARSAPELWVRPMAGGAPRQLTNDGYPIDGWTWSPDSREIVFASKRAGWFGLWRIGVNGGEPAAIPDTVDAVYPTMARAASASVRRDLLAYQRRTLHVSFQETELAAGPPPVAGALKPILQSTRLDSSPQISPDGKSMAFVSDRGGFEEIWRSDAMGRNAAPLTALGARILAPGSPRWSPDSRQIVFDVREHLHSNIYVISAEGGAPRRVTNWSSDQIRPRWSRDGQSIYFGSIDGGKWQMWKVPANAADVTREQARLLTQESGFEPEESSDGKAIYFYRLTGQNVGELYSVPAAGGPAVKAMDNIVSHGWWALGRNGIYFVGLTPGRAASPVPRIGRPIQFFSFATHRVTDLGIVTGRINVRTPDFCISPDERRLLYGQVDAASSNIMLVE